MRLTDLELYRWKFHNDIYVHTTNKYRPGNYPLLNWFQYWIEHGAFVSILPRQSGKSQMIITIINHNDGEKEDYRIICSTRSGFPRFTKAGLDRNKMFEGRSVKKGFHLFQGIKHEEINLFVDEFEHIDMKNHLIHILNYPWKSVTMVSSL